MLRRVLWVALLAAAAPAAAQPTSPDLEYAAELYRTAEQAMNEARYDEAAKDYGAAYEIAKDPVLFFKIASALERAGKCGAAVTYYQRYLREGSPSPDFQKLTNARIAGCAEGSGAAPTDGASAPPLEPALEEPASPEPEPLVVEEPRAPIAEPPTDGAEPASASPRQTAAWIAVGAGIAFVTVGTVFALSVESTEDDLADLYLTGVGQPPRTYDRVTQERYQDLVDRGQRYQTLSWVSFGLAAGAAAAATYWFLTQTGGEKRTSALRLAPLVSPRGAGLGASGSF
ncbi:MAG: hypothetical protein R3B48_07825 [Kofleriaceae bacterium]